MLYFSRAIFIVISSEDPGNKTKTKLTMAYLIPWTGQYTFGKVIGPVILKALENVKNRGLLSNYDIELQWRDNVMNLLE